MSIRTRSNLLRGLLLLAALTAHTAQAQTRDPSYGHASLALEEPASTCRTTTDPATRLWQRIMTWSTRRTSDQRWRALYSRPSTAPVGTPAKTTTR